MLYCAHCYGFQLQQAMLANGLAVNKYSVVLESPTVSQWNHHLATSVTTVNTTINTPSSQRPGARCSKRLPHQYERLMKSTNHARFPVARKHCTCAGVTNRLPCVPVGSLPATGFHSGRQQLEGIFHSSSRLLRLAAHPDAAQDRRESRAAYAVPHLRQRWLQRCAVGAG